MTQFFNALLVLLMQVPDLSSPRSAARSFYEAAERGDADAIKQILSGDTDLERELGDAYAKLIVSSRRFADAAKKRYGGAADAIAQGAFPAGEVEKIDSATLKETDDTATLQISSITKPLTFRRTDAGWRLVLTDLTSAPDKLEGQVELTRGLADAFSDLADDVTAGKYATVQDAETAIQQRINDVMVRSERKLIPTTKPATTPASGATGGSR